MINLLYEGRSVGVIPLDGDERQSHLEGPSVHDGLDVDILRQDPISVGLLCQELPQLVLSGISVRPITELVSNQVCSL